MLLLPLATAVAEDPSSPAEPPAAETAATRAVPDTLSLPQALTFAEHEHPHFAEARARRDMARADVELQGSGDDLSIQATAIGRLVQPPASSPNQDQEDHQASLLIRKPLYDFGRTGNRHQAAEHALDGAEQKLLDVGAARRLAILETYFEVVLADLRAGEANEAMSVAFVRYDRTQERQKLGLASDLDVQHARSKYEVIRQQRYLAEAGQRATRSRLALALGYPRQLPTTVLQPALKLDADAWPDFDALLARASDNNPRLQNRKAALEAARYNLRAARSEYLPRLDSEFEASWYARQFGSRDDWRAQISLTVPLYGGDRVSGLVQMQQARVDLAQAELETEEHELRQRLLEQWLALTTLKAKRDLAAANMDYREMELDRARTEYQQELRTDLGDAMTETSAARWLLARVDFDLALTIARIDALLGQPLSIIEAPKP